MSTSNDGVEGSSTYDGYVWEVETSAPDDAITDESEANHVDQEAADKTIVFIISSILASFTIPAIFGSVFLLGPLLIAFIGLFWGFRARRQGIKTKVLTPVMLVAIAMMLVGYLAMRFVPDSSWESIYPILFRVGTGVLVFALVGIFVILLRGKTKAK